MEAPNKIGIKKESLSIGKSLDFMDMNDLLDTLEMILDQAYLGILFVDTDGVIRFMNKLLEEMGGVDRKKFYGKHITELIPDSRLPLVIKTGRAELGWKYRYQGGNAIVNRIPIFKNNQLIGAITQVIFSDVSELKTMAQNMDLLKKKLHTYKHQISDMLTPKYNFQDILGVSEVLNHIKETARIYAEAESPVLIIGETGTGKEMLAHSIHNASKNNDGPFVCLNCAAIPSELLESELFGYAAGAFTGARNSGKAGKIEMANGGTLFLDEIGELPLLAQAKLLRVLEEKRVEKLGAVIPKEVKFRLVAASNRDLDLLRDEGQFRDDLYFRLSVLTLQFPPLRERREDIPILSQHFLKQLSARSVQITDEAMHALTSYAWPGNVRELKNAIELAKCLAQNQEFIGPDKLPVHITKALSKKVGSPSPKDQAPEKLDMKRKVSEDEKMLIRQALDICRGNKSKAAKALGISRSLLYKRLAQYSISY